MKYIVRQSIIGFLFFALGLLSIVIQDVLAHSTGYHGFLLGLIFVIYSLCFVEIEVEK